MRLRGTFLGLQVTFLGTASGLPAPDRFGQTVVVTAKDGADDPPRHYLLDVGDGASSLLMRHGISHCDIAVIFISHMHADHHGGLAQVIKTAMHTQRTKPLAVIAPGEGIAPLQAYLAASYLLEPFLGFKLNWIPIDESVGSPIALDHGAHLTAYANNHLRGYGRRLEKLSLADNYRLESYSAALVIGSLRVVYAGNLAGARGHDELAPFVEPCDMLITELAHTDPRELGRFLKGRSIGHTAVAHFHPKWNGVSNAQIMSYIQQGAEESTIAERVTLTRDSTILELSPPPL